jgi:hypothetical protein
LWPSFRSFHGFGKCLRSHAACIPQRTRNVCLVLARMRLMTVS